MKNIISSIFLTILFFLGSCVKDPAEIDKNELFSVKINSIELKDAIIIADNTIRYKVEIEVLNGVIIDNDKQITVTVSDGGVASTSNVTPAGFSGQIIVSMQSGKATFYYNPGKSAQSSTILSFTLQGLNQVFNFPILPSEPSLNGLQLMVTPANPRMTDDVTLIAYLIKDSQTKSNVSNNLKVTFTTSKPNVQDAIEVVPLIPNYANSILDDASGNVTSRITMSTNRKPGKLTLTATYTGTDNQVRTDSKTIEFVP